MQQGQLVNCSGVHGVGRKEVSIFALLVSSLSCIKSYGANRLSCVNKATNLQRFAV